MSGLATLLLTMPDLLLRATVVVSKAVVSSVPELVDDEINAFEAEFLRLRDLELIHSIDLPMRF